MRELTRLREGLRQQIIGEIGRSRRYDNIMRKIRRELLARKTSLKKKYREKVDHLAKERRKEIEERRLSREVPTELNEFKECKVFDSRILDKLEVATIEGVVIGEVIVDKDELAILQMNPKFCVMKRLIDEEIERDIELSITKLRYEISALEEKLKLESLHLNCF